jgi:predicted PhzF superfamily epimerase YddE/YHI9
MCRDFHGSFPNALVRMTPLIVGSVASQGCCVGRDGLVAVEFDEDTIWLGGHAVSCIEGSLRA